jgi:hypothetical protein
MARLWADVVNCRGDDVTLVHFPEIGIRGNTHFPFLDLNNLEIADLLSKFLKEKRLNVRKNRPAYSKQLWKMLRASTISRSLAFSV